MDNYLKLIMQGKKAFADAALSIGWFEYSSLTYETVLERLTEMDDKIFSVFSLSEMEFDSEGFESAGAYQSVVAELLRLTEHMKDAEIACEFDDETESIKISIQGERGRYIYFTDENDDWFDGKVIDSFLNETVLPGEGLELRFFVLPPCDQMAYVVFVPRPMYEEAVSRGLIPAEEGYFLEDTDSE